MTIETFEADDLIIKVPVTFEAGAEIQALTGGAVQAFAKSYSGATAIAASATIVDANTIRVVFSDGTLSAGSYLLQVRATVSTITQTLVNVPIDVKASI